MCFVRMAMTCTLESNDSFLLLARRTNHGTKTVPRGRENSRNGPEIAHEGSRVGGRRLRGGCACVRGSRVVCVLWRLQKPRLRKNTNFKTTRKA